MTVQKGDTGAAVTRVQTLINQLGHKPALVIDGEAGPATDAGIRWAQKLLGVTVDGQWGPDTDAAAQARLGAAAPATPKTPFVSKHDVNGKATDFLLANLGPKEQNSKNDGPWLRVHQHEVGDDWMWKGHNPYCAEVGATIAYHEGAELELKKLWPTVNWAYCPSIHDAILARLVSKDGKWRIEPVALGSLRRGDICLPDWNHDGKADHLVHFLRKPIIRGIFLAWTRPIRTVEANTPLGEAGDQSGLGSGDGIWKRTRSERDILVAGRIVPNG